jgi:hypothetical protein
MSDFFNNPSKLFTTDFGSALPSWASSLNTILSNIQGHTKDLRLPPAPAPLNRAVLKAPFANAWVGGSILLEGLGNMVRGIRGREPAPQGMATRMLSDYIAQQRDEDRLNKILDRIGGAKDDSSSVLASALLRPSLQTDNPLRGLG